jgi:hypothetical protein
MKKQRLSGAGQRVRVGRRMLAPPRVSSMTGPDPAPDSGAPAAKPDDGDPEKPTDALSEELIRMIKAAYQ